MSGTRAGSFRQSWTRRQFVPVFIASCPMQQSSLAHARRRLLPMNVVCFNIKKDPKRHSAFDAQRSGIKTASIFAAGIACCGTGEIAFVAAIYCPERRHETVQIQRHSHRRPVQSETSRDLPPFDATNRQLKQRLCTPANSKSLSPHVMNVSPQVAVL